MIGFCWFSTSVIPLEHLIIARTSPSFQSMPRLAWFDQFKTFSEISGKKKIKSIIMLLRKTKNPKFNVGFSSSYVSQWFETCLSSASSFDQNGNLV